MQVQVQVQVQVRVCDLELNADVDCERFGAGARVAVVVVLILSVVELARVRGFTVAEFGIAERDCEWGLKMGNFLGGLVAGAIGLASGLIGWRLPSIRSSR